MTKEEEQLLNKFMNEDNIQENIKIDQAIEQELEEKREEEIKENRLKDPRVITVYNDVSKLMKDYTTGQLTKAFKAIPFI